MLVTPAMVRAMTEEEGSKTMPEPMPLPGHGLSTTGKKIYGIAKLPEGPHAKRLKSRDQKFKRAETLKRHLERQEKYSLELSTLQEELQAEADPFNEAQVNDLLATGTDEESFEEASESMLRESSDEEATRTPKRKLASEVHVPSKRRDLRKSPSKSRH